MYNLLLDCLIVVYCCIIVGLLLDCWILLAVGLLLDFCWIIVGLLLDYCLFVVGLLFVCCYISLVPTYNGHVGLDYRDAQSVGSLTPIQSPVRQLDR